MDLYEAVAHAFTTMPTGGFSTEARSVEAFGAASQWAIAFFMVLAGANFALMYRALAGRRTAPRSHATRSSGSTSGCSRLASLVIGLQLAAEDSRRAKRRSARPSSRQSR